MVYELLLLVGLVGLGAQALLGSHARGGHGHGHTGHAHAGHGHAAHGHAAHGHAAHGHAAQGHAAHGHGAQQAQAAHGHTAHGHELRARTGATLAGMLSPMALCGICVGAGAAGIVLKTWLAAPLALALASAAVGLAFYFIVIRPLTETLMRFASAPAQNLSGSVAQEAEAMSRFDENGRGIVRLTVDGQLVRILATLDNPAETVNTGDRLLVVSIDPKRNTCRVTPL